MKRHLVSSDRSGLMGEAATSCFPPDLFARLRTRPERDTTPSGPGTALGSRCRALESDCSDSMALSGL
jgi:hypothetical protein